MKKKQILLTNDDGIRSPGLWAAAEALSELGFVTVAAPREQSSGMGRSLPNTSDGIITEEKVQINGQEWTAYAVGGSPAQAVQHGILEIMPERPDLVVSGINYGENMGIGVSVSGTVGAALEAVALRVPALAISLETDKADHLSYSENVDFSIAAYFATLFAQKLLEKDFPPQTDLLKVDVPRNATVQTPWRTTHLSNNRYYHPLPEKNRDWSKPSYIDYEIASLREDEPHTSDVYGLRKYQEVTVTPLTLDFTARVNLDEFDSFLRK
jgi:5'-nucleotidase